MRCGRSETRGTVAAALAVMLCGCEPSGVAPAWSSAARELAALSAAFIEPARARAEPAPAVAPTAHETPAAVAVQALESTRARTALAAIPALASLAERFAPFSDADADLALRRGDRSRQSIQVWTIMPSLFAWKPIPEKTFWVLSGRVGTEALLAVLELRADGTFAHAGSTLIDEDEATLAIGSSAEYPKQLTWSSCYGCAGEGGTIRFADDGRVEFTYR